ncbi:MAG: NYN domain-containing protein [Chloroflexota bacterium]
MQLLIDGHNLIAKLPNIHLDEADDEEKLITLLRRYQARSRFKITVFFDSGHGFHLAKKISRVSITVHYARHGSSADNLIISHLRKARNPRQIRVITSDMAIQRVAYQVQAEIISATDFVPNLIPTPTPIPIRNDDPSTQEDITLSEDEVDAWLDLFEGNTPSSSP